MDSQREINKRARHKEEEEDSVGRLPRDLTVGIYSRLPISSVIKFRFACRSWNLLCRDLYFAKMHMSCSLISQRNCLIFHPIENELQFVEFSDVGDNEIVRKFNIPFLNSMREFCVIGSCNGLLCIIDSYFNTKSIYVYNPFTRDYSYIVPPKPMKVGCDFAHFGFGFHPVTKEYKVILIAYESTRMQSLRPDVLIYNVGNNEWRSTGKPRYGIKKWSRPGVLVSGRLHWMGKPEKHYNNFIVSFDLSDDSFDMLKLDTITLPSQQSYRCDLVALGDRLSVAVDYHMACMKYIDVWVMKEYGKQESWLKMYTLSQASAILLNQYWLVIGLLKNGELLVDCGGRNLFSYNHQDARFKRLWFQGMPKLFSTMLHVGSLCRIVKSSAMNKQLTTFVACWYCLAIN